MQLLLSTLSTVLWTMLTWGALTRRARVFLVVLVIRRAIREKKLFAHGHLFPRYNVQLIQDNGTRRVARVLNHTTRHEDTIVVKARGVPVHVRRVFVHSVVRVPAHGSICVD
ncbi:hypothetical protein PsorP6_000578 [Peronosclerospora sorghi]|uniref:Uncharacterized protein n=1 Tax=Peronosclerospora sorghi TaxID=230839 RepID=A0ACC0WRG2_9STRA|nr:hypothetical protein PsorP6_000578 [Peronosclerospora sorghi]